MKIHENFICQQCYKSIEHSDYYSCRLHEDKNISFNSVACSDFDPRSTVKDSYRIYVLESRVEKLEAILTTVQQ